MNSKFTQKAQNALNAALSSARTLGHTYIGSEHILLGLVAEKENAASKMLSAKGISPDMLLNSAIILSGKGNESNVGASDMTPCVKRIIEESGNTSKKLGQSYIGTEHILIALLNEKDSVAVKILESCSVSIEELKKEVFIFLGGVNENSKNKAKAHKSDEKQLSALSGFGKDLTCAARLGKIDPVIGRDAETTRIIQILSRRIKNNPCLIGEPGVGKTAIIEGLAQRICNHNVPEQLQDKIIIMLDIPSMIAGAKYRGEFEERMKSVINEVSKRPEIILFIDEIHTITGAGAAEGALDAANIIKPALARGDMRVIGATTIDEYRRHIEKDAALERRFQPVIIGEPSPNETIEILKGLRDKFESHHGVKITDDAITSSVELSRRYINDRFLPDKAIDLIDETAARICTANATEPKHLQKIKARLESIIKEKESAITSQKFEIAAGLRDEEGKTRLEYERQKAEWNKSRPSQNYIFSKDISNTVSEITGIPLGEFSSNEENRLLNIESKIKEKIIGQDSAAISVANAIRRARTGLSDPNRPTGSFIFLGPTGVGKTEFATVLAEIVFGNRNALIRLDMSEFMEKHSISKLIGSPPGYIGYSEGGMLTEKVRRAPYSLILFDEIEKAHHDVFNIFLQILDNGRLTDSQGRIVDFRNTIIIMTSNIGGNYENTSLGFGNTSNNQSLKQENAISELKKTFRPEFLNRIDEIVVFSPLNRESILTITDRLLSELSQRALNHNISMSFDPSVIGFIADKAYNEKYGARPLKRAVNEYIGDMFSMEYLKGTFKSGDNIIVKLSDNQISFLKKN